MDLSIGETQRHNVKIRTITRCRLDGFDNNKQYVLADCILRVDLIILYRRDTLREDGAVTAIPSSAGTDPT